MQIASFTLSSPLNGKDGGAVSAMLLAMPGVTDVKLGDTCRVVYDERAVTPPQLQVALAGAGVASELAVPAARGASCCGACGG